VAAGVQQENVLGTLLYCLYSYDMPLSDASLPGTSMMETFADDVCVTYRSCFEQDAPDGIQDFASTFAKWARRWNMVSMVTNQRMCAHKPQAWQAGKGARLLPADQSPPFNFEGV